MRDFVEHLLQHPVLGPMVAHHRRLEGSSATLGEPSRPLPPRLAEGLESQGLGRLYAHQTRGIDLVRAGHNVLVVTPTSSGKTLLFSTALLESFIADAGAKALLLYPTKALAQDQLAGFRSLAGSLGALDPPRFEIYDGDTPAGRRRKIKADLPQALITNPDMLHMGILSRHQDWEGLLGDLRWIVLDEMHVYRGLFGTHVHHILQRLQRLCRQYGSRPQFIAASATVGNPSAFAETLVGRPFEVVSESGAPQAARDVVFLNPVGVSPYTAAVRVLAEALRADLRTIAFTKARRVTELLYAWLVRQQPEMAQRVAPYRAGYLPEERRRLEKRLFGGDLSAVLTTSALELGIDVGGLDVCILVGYPGSLISSWQRIGRVGRRKRDGLVVLIALPDALDQYIVHHPDLFFGSGFERAVLNPSNPFVAGRHLVCAAAEDPLTADELGRAGLVTVAGEMVREGRLVQDATGERYFAFRRNPHRDVSPRSTGTPFSIVDKASGKLLGSVDAKRVYHECHEGAVYLHGGQSFAVLDLDTERKRVSVVRARVDYYTVVLGDKETEILERHQSKRVGPFAVGLGRLRVTVRIREYQKKRLFGGETISNHPLEAPPLVFETIGFWIELPPELAAAFTARELHFMGGIHATEHAMIGLFPLLAIAERDDIGGISYTGHPQTGCPSIFIYDGVPGGAGLAEHGFSDLEQLVSRTLELVSDCSCDDGCPGCIQSPKCGNGNKPLDKAAARLTLELLDGKASLDALGVRVQPMREPERIVPVEALADTTRSEAATGSAAAADPSSRHGISRVGNLEPEEARAVREASLERIGRAVQAPPPSRPETLRTLVFDLETQHSADDVGGWANADKMRLGLAVVYDAHRDAYRTYHEADVKSLLLDLVMADRVVGFNLDRFDLNVLSAYTEWDLNKIRTLDLLRELHGKLGFRLSLAHLSEVNLGESKSGDGLQSLQWWREGRIDLIEQYCKKDVDLTRRLFELGREQGYLLYRDHSDRTVRVPVDW